MRILGPAALLIFYALAPFSDALAQSPTSLRCDEGDKPMLSGSIVRARETSALENASIRVQWIEITVANRRLVSKAHVDSVVSEANGRFRICGIPVSGGVRLRVSREGFQPIEGDVELSRSDPWRREVRLVETNARTGTGSVAGKATLDGTPIASGTASVSALKLEVPIANGAFTFKDMPAGTWIVDVRAIGYEPQQLWVDVNERTSAPLDVAMAKEAQQLEAVNVIGKPGRDVRLLQDVLDRNRTFAGSLILPGNLILETAMLASDVVRAARGFTVQGPSDVTARPNGRVRCASRSTDIPNPGNRNRAGAFVGKEIAIYVDGLRWKFGLEEVNHAVPPKDLLAVELYPEITTAPVEWRTNDACAVIAFWTKK